MARSRAIDHDQKRVALLKAAADIFAAKGIDRASMAEVAEQGGISKALIYHYYASKDALVFDIIDRHLAELEAAVAEAACPEAGAEAHFTALIAALLSSYMNADAKHRVQLDGLARLPSEMQHQLKERERNLVRQMSAAIVALQPKLEGDSRLRPITMSIFGMLNWHYMWFRPHGPLSRADYAALVAQFCIAGLRGLR